MCTIKSVYEIMLKTCTFPAFLCIDKFGLWRGAYVSKPWTKCVPQRIIHIFICSNVIRMLLLLMLFMPIDPHSMSNFNQFRYYLHCSSLARFLLILFLITPVHNMVWTKSFHDLYNHVYTQWRSNISHF